MCAQFIEGLRAVADGGFYCCAEFAEGFGVAVGDEEGVVAEAVRAGGFERDVAFDGAGLNVWGSNRSAARDK